ncbi:response regulator transcription factor [Phenylobacterium sp. LH3H17]|uniref:response regulator transcription factor n=1 Tax=Phenylobacterium sp. LH3H17 TaxID=2903901 RepID=UPI0020C97EBB|nr:response regulator transcription factor [Phenylobacterium sp. LH3H17]UTP38318.1 response regulator transcription factor [Phenylobacterium sp. LH3H17]
MTEAPFSSIRTLDPSAASTPSVAMQSAPLIVEEKPICRMALTQILGECTQTVPPRFAASIDGALHQVAAYRPGFLLVDLFTINYEFNDLRRLLAQSPWVAAIAVDDRVNPTFARLARDAGARGYASKDFALPRFRSALRAVIEGGAYFPADILPDRPRPRTIRTAAGLSDRQLEVLKQMAVGKTNREIAETLGITPGTVKLHTHQILKLTGARNRTEAALIAGRFLAPARQ